MQIKKKKFKLNPKLKLIIICALVLVLVVLGIAVYKFYEPADKIVMRNLKKIWQLTSQLDLESINIFMSQSELSHEIIDLEYEAIPVLINQLHHNREDHRKSQVLAYLCAMITHKGMLMDWETGAEWYDRYGEQFYLEYGNK